MHDKTDIKSYDNVINKVYGYMLPYVQSHQGYVKVGQTGKDVENRISQQTGIMGLDYNLLWKKIAQRNDETWFTDKDLRNYL